MVLENLTGFGEIVKWITGTAGIPPVVSAKGEKKIGESSFRKTAPTARASGTPAVPVIT
ncbi:MAG: hypothetical protein ABJC10_14385 [Acidobacteriota bacterium]